MTEKLVDQLPVLIDLRRYLEELTILEAPEQTSVQTNPIIEIVSEFASMQTKDWQTIADDQLKLYFSPDIGSDAEEAKRVDMMRLAKIYDFEGIEDLLDAPKCAKCGVPATQRCSRCKTEWYCKYVTTE